MISIIVAVAQNRVIGGNNELLWHISEDLKRFKSITSGHPVLMGRKTFESLGRALPGRTNVVVTRNPDFAADGCTVIDSLQKALSLFDSREEVFIIGGGEIYRQAIDLADRLYLTKIHRDYRGDTIFPEIDEDTWEAVSVEYHQRGEKFPYPFEYINYVRRR